MEQTTHKIINFSRCGSRHYRPSAQFHERASAVTRPALKCTHSLGEVALEVHPLVGT